MLPLNPPLQRYDWGSSRAIPDLLGLSAAGGPVAEAWFGAHPSAPSLVRTAEGERPLDDFIAQDPDEHLGADVVARFGPALPYLLKLIAADSPLSLQVHPNLERARAGFREEEARGIPLGAAERSYRDTNHKPELVLALTPFEAMCGFRAPRRVVELLTGLGADLARELRTVLAGDPTPEGVREAFTFLLQDETRPTAEQVRLVAQACATRLSQGSPSPRADRTVVQLQAAYPGDPGVVTSLLLNPVTLQPGEALFVPAGGVHAYLEGVGVEIMASSDNVLRAGLTHKHVNTAELLRNVNYVAAPPIRIAPEVFHGSTRVFYAPVDDFELSVTQVDDEAEHPLPGRGPRVLLCLAGELTAWGPRCPPLTLARGEAAFAPASDGPLTIEGRGRLVQADVP